jgi:chromosome segregation ATPase
MARALSYVPIFLAGIGAGALAFSRRQRGGMDAAAAEGLKRSITGLEARLSTQESANAERFGKIETRLEEHTAQLADVPSTTQIVAAMEQLLSKTMASLDERLTTQARSIEVLKTTVSQTDTLLERVLESLDSLQTYAEPADLAGDTLLQRPAV